MGDSRGAERPASLIPPTYRRMALNEPLSLSVVLLALARRWTVERTNRINPQTPQPAPSPEYAGPATPLLLLPCIWPCRMAAAVTSWRP